MTIALIAPGHPMMLAPGKAALLSPLSGIGSSGTTGSGNGGPVTSLSAIAGLSGWWDAGTPGRHPRSVRRRAHRVRCLGRQPGRQVGRRRAADRLSPGAAAASTAADRHAAPERLAGRRRPQHGGPADPARVRPAASGDGPGPGPDQRRDAAGVRQRLDALPGLVAAQLAAGVERRQHVAEHRRHRWCWPPTTPPAATACVLFPGAQQTVLTTALTRRHTHAVILRNNAGTGVDVWLDGTQVATPAPNPLAASLSAPLLFLHSGGTKGGAECWFHEAATWPPRSPPAISATC